MIACQFIFQPGEYDDEFTRLDDSIEAHARSLAGYVGVDRWRDTENGSVLNYIYYFTDMDAVRELARFQNHLAAKREYARWYQGYQIIVSEVQRVYGDGRLQGLTELNEAGR